MKSEGSESDDEIFFFFKNLQNTGPKEGEQRGSEREIEIFFFCWGKRKNIRASKALVEKRDGQRERERDTKRNAKRRR